MIHIITDSMSDYTHVAFRDGRVTIVPQPVRFGLQEFMDDGAALPLPDFYARMRTAADLPVAEDDNLVVILRIEPIEGEEDAKAYIGVDDEDEAEAVFQLFKQQNADEYNFID